jgi:hypothetical protein
LGKLIAQSPTVKAADAKEQVTSVPKLVVAAFELEAKRPDEGPVSATAESPEEELGPLTDEDWEAARKSLGKGSRSILFGTSDRVIDAAVSRLSNSSKTRHRPAPGVA